MGVDMQVYPLLAYFQHPQCVKVVSHIVGTYKAWQEKAPKKCSFYIHNLYQLLKMIKLANFLAFSVCVASQ